MTEITHTLEAGPEVERAPDQKPAANTASNDPFASAVATHQSSDAAPDPGSVTPHTALTESLSQHGHSASSVPRLVDLRGRLTPSTFGSFADELRALTSSAGVFDLGSRVRFAITGADRVRWLNGMVTNTVKALPADAHNYNFILNAQGRIQGDATVFAFPDRLLLETDRAQLELLHNHLDRFIIMDEVELAPAPAPVDAEPESTLGLAGPHAARILAALGLPVPPSSAYAVAGRITVVAEHAPQIPRYSLWVPAGEVLSLWQQLAGAGAMPAGALASEAFRIGEALPVYGVDITDRSLPQETAQAHALNFNKGCYLGQEIVERIRSQAKIHRGLRLFGLQGSGDVAGGAPLSVAGAPAPVGELTSISAPLPSGLRLALATVRLEALQGHPTLSYPGGAAAALATPLAWETVLPPASA